MTGIEAAVRKLVDADRDCAPQALAQMELRRKLHLLISEWMAAGGGTVLPDIRDPKRLRQVRTDGQGQQR